MKRYKVMFCKYETIEIDDAENERDAIRKARNILDIACPSMKNYDDVEVDYEELDGEEKWN